MLCKVTFLFDWFIEWLIDQKLWSNFHENSSIVWNSWSEAFLIWYTDCQWQGVTQREGIPQGEFQGFGELELSIGSSCWNIDLLTYLAEVVPVSASQAGKSALYWCQTTYSTQWRRSTWRILITDNTAFHCIMSRIIRMHLLSHTVLERGGMSFWLMTKRGHKA